jgi:gamma-glutamyl hercynylcysteine S-oxide hydrolase
MCRMLAYLGNNILLSKLLLIPEHSLEKQAWQSKELRETKLNADGFGFAWYPDSSSAAYRYRNILPIWNDSNLPALSNSLQRPLWMAIVRSAPEGLSVTLDNTPPFTQRQWCFIHNGYLLNFETNSREKIRHELSAEYLALIKDSTDFEYLFALLMQQLETNTPIIAIQKIKL